MNKEEIVEKLTETLKGFPQLVLAYVHGSFLNQENFHDLDLAVLLARDLDQSRQWKCALEIAMHAEKAINHLVPIDVHLLNQAPFGFQRAVLDRGELVFARSEEERVRYEKRVILAYLDWKPMDDFFSRKLLEGILLDRT